MGTWIVIYEWRKQLSNVILPPFLTAKATASVADDDQEMDTGGSVLSSSVTSDEGVLSGGVAGAAPTSRGTGMLKQT